MKCVLMSGSPRGKRSTSYSLLKYLSEELEKEGMSCTKYLISDVNASSEYLKEMMLDVGTSDCVVLAAPLYIDTLPAHVLQVLMDIAQHCKDYSESCPRFIGIVNSGFPESEHNDLALDILEQFCHEANFRWAGGLPFGGGGIIGGMPLHEIGGRGRNAKQAMDLLVQSLLKGEDVTTETIDQIKRQMIPKRAYIVFAQSGWKQMSKRNGVAKLLDARPYQLE